MILLILIIINSADCAHFRGGMISWRPATNNISVLNTQQTIIIDQRYAWSRSAADSGCTTTTITSHGIIGESAVHVLKCESSASICSSVQYTTDISTYEPCTDFNTALGMSFGHSSTAVNLTVRSTGVVIGYVVNSAWLVLQSGGGSWSLMTYINMQPRSDNQLINSSPTSDIPSVIYVPASSTLATAIDIPMSDADGDDIQCRFAKSSSLLGSTTVNECAGVCASSVLPSSTQLISGNNTCTLIVTLPHTGYYAVAIQIEDYDQNTSTILSSVPLQFLILTYDNSNPISSCTSIPVITSIPPDLPAPGDTITIQVGVLYTAMVIAKTGCLNDTDTSITNFITSSPPGMLKSYPPFYLSSSSSYAINLTWTPTTDQLGQTFVFCAVAIDINYLSSDQYCFNILVGPKTTTTTTTTTTSTTSSTTATTSTTSTTSTTTTTTTSATTTSSTSTTSTTTTTITTPPHDYNPLIFGLGLGLGLPLLLLLGLLGLCCLLRYCSGSLKSLTRRRLNRDENTYCPLCRRSVAFEDSQKQMELKCTTPDGTRRYRQLYLNNNEDKALDDYRKQYVKTDPERPPIRPLTSLSERDSFPLTTSFFSNSTSTLLGSQLTTVTSLHSPSIISLPTVNISNKVSPTPPQLNHHRSLLVQAYTTQSQV
ncbi:unnamed protein product [Adineta steineri]|uniref:Uncharacterized protein n=1 Tax=Adineta steineri TaxID=433720 RepID=A0A819CVJ0_9BILA|nr:unnamed protein product [Adineta steineri]CAF3827477.1 unnamed protein product [Adineta steineri]